MTHADNNPAEERRKWIEGWNTTMVDIWTERMALLGIADTKSLIRSTKSLPVKADGRCLNLHLAQSFLEYGLWQDLGTGREIPLGNPGDVKYRDPEYRREHGLDRPKQRGRKWGGGFTSGNPRLPRRWFSVRYYKSVLKLRDFMAASLGHDFSHMIVGALDAEKLRRRSAYYTRRGV